METDKFTPGEWQSNQTSNDEGGHARTVWTKDSPDGPDSVLICFVKSDAWAGSQPTDWREINANARLIASAPDLLAACRKALTCASIDSSVRAVIVAAISKATGGAA